MFANPAAPSARGTASAPSSCYCFRSSFSFRLSVFFVDSEHSKFVKSSFKAKFVKRKLHGNICDATQGNQLLKKQTQLRFVAYLLPFSSKITNKAAPISKRRHKSQNHEYQFERIYFLLAYIYRFPQCADFSALQFTTVRQHMRY